jgi:hypothetical protein
MINLNVPDKYVPIIEAEAKARNLTVEQLFLTAIADYIPRGAKCPEGRLMPLQLHMGAKERKAVVPAAMAAGESVNHYICRAVGHRIFNEKKRGEPWPCQGKRSEIARAKAASVEAEAKVELPNAA